MTDEQAMKINQRDVTLIFVQRQLEEAERLAAMWAKNLRDIEAAIDMLDDVFATMGRRSGQVALMNCLKEEQRQIASEKTNWFARLDVLQRVNRSLGGES